MWVSTLSPCSFLSRFPAFPQKTSLSLVPNRRHSSHFLQTCPSFSRLLADVLSLASPPPYTADSSPQYQGCFVFLPRPTGSIKTTKCCLSIRWYAHSWSTTLLWHSPGGTGLPTLSRFPLCSTARVPFRLSPFSSTAVASFFVLLSEDLRIHGRSLRFLIIPA